MTDGTAADGWFKPPLSEKELKDKLGEYVAPKGLYQKTKAMPFLGSVKCNTDRLVAGEWTEIVLDYEVGASGIADGAWIKATFKFYSDWALFQTTDPAGANYVSAEYHAGPCVEGQVPATVQSLKVRFDQKGHERPFQKAIIVDTVDGYVKPIDIYSDDEITEIRGYFDDLLQKTIAAGGDSYSISTAHMKHGRVYDMLTNSKIVDYVADILGENVIGWGSHFFCKMPHDGKAVAWHQDASYWPLSPSKAVTVWLAIDDADLENGCMKFIAGSQKFGQTYGQRKG